MQKNAVVTESEVTGWHLPGGTEENNVNS